MGRARVQNNSAATPQSSKRRIASVRHQDEWFTMRSTTYVRQRVTGSSAAAPLVFSDPVRIAMVPDVHGARANLERAAGMVDMHSARIDAAQSMRVQGGVRMPESDAYEREEIVVERRVRAEPPQSDRGPTDAAFDPMLSYPTLGSMRMRHLDHARSVKSRIVRADNRMLDRPELQGVLQSIMQSAEALVASIGPQHVYELYVHYDTRIESDRCGATALAHYTVALHADADASKLPVNYGSAITYTKTSTRARVDWEDAVRRLSSASVGHTNGDAALFRDESTTHNARLDHWQDLPIPELACGGSVNIMRGFNVTDGDTVGIVVQNHSSDAVKVLHESVRRNKMSISHLYRSDAYATAMMHGAMQCAAMTAVAARVMGLAVPSQEHVVGKRTSGSPMVVELADVTRYAPTVFIEPVLAPDGSQLLFLVHVGTYGDYTNSLLPSYTSDLEMGVKRTGTANSHHGYTFIDGPTIGAHIITLEHDIVSPPKRIWLGARMDRLLEIQQAKQAHLEDLTATLHPGRVTPGYPTGGMYLPLAKSGAASERTSFELATSRTTRYNSHVNPYQVSDDYVSLFVTDGNSPVATDTRRLRIALFPESQFNVRDSLRSQALFVSGVNTGVVSLAGLVRTISPTDYIVLPCYNTAMVTGIMKRMLRYAADCGVRNVTTTDETRRITAGRTLPNTKRADAFLHDASGGAVQYDGDSLLIDHAWLVHVIEKQTKKGAPQ